MNRFLKLVAILVACTLVFAACGGSGEDGELAKLGPAERYEKMMEKEAKKLPDFSVKVVEDPNLKVEGMPEEVTWLTADLPDYGSPMTKKGGTFHLSVPQYAENYRFIGPQGNHSQRQYMNTSTGTLWSSDETKEFFCGTASHWAFGADNQTVYYKLRDFIKWSDGTPCTADDYVWGWQMWCDPLLDDPWYNKYGAKIEIKKINDYCIAVKWLESDTLTKFELLDNTIFRPIQKKFFDNGKLYKNWHVDYNWKYMPTIGPYVLDEEKTIKGELFVLKKVKDWWGDKVPFFKSMANFDYLEFKVITGGREIEKEYFYKGELDIFGLTQAQYWNEAATQKNVTDGYIDRWISNFSPSSGMGGMFFNCQFEFFKDKKVRQAMYYAIDMQGMIDNVMQGEVKRQHNIGMGNVWAGYDFNDHSIKKPDFDPEKAGELLAEAGYDKLGSDGIRVNKEGKRASFELLYPQPDNTERFSYLKEQAKKAGVEIELKLLSQGWIPLVFDKAFQAAFFYWTYNFQPSYWQNFSKENAEKKDTNNVSGWWSDEMEALLDVENDATVPLKEKAENNKKIERLVHEEALMIPAWYTDYSRLGAWKWIKFPAWCNQKYTKSPIPSDIWNYAWFDQEIKDEVEKARAEGKTFEPKIWKLSTRYIED